MACQAGAHESVCAQQHPSSNSSLAYSCHFADNMFAFVLVSQDKAYMQDVVELFVCVPCARCAWAGGKGVTFREKACQFECLTIAP